MYIYQQNCSVPYHRSCDEAQFSIMALVCSPLRCLLLWLFLLTLLTCGRHAELGIVTKKENDTRLLDQLIVLVRVLHQSPDSPVSTHTPGDGVNTASSLQHVSSGQKGYTKWNSHQNNEESTPIY